MAKDEDVLLARTLIQNGVLTKEQVAHCLKVVDQREALQIAIPLKHVIVELGILTEEALAPHLAPKPLPAAPGGLPTELGGFKLIRKVGQGALGTVWEAEQVSLAKRVAVKVLKPALASRTDLVEGFLREARAAATLVHPNVVHAIAAGEDKGFFYFAMEYVEGDTLRGLIEKRGRLPERQALLVARSIAEGLGAAARCGLVHRDIKPANVLVSVDSVVKIADFGLAHAPSIAAPGWGTPDYMAPEQVTGQSRVDVRSDLYALGATLFYLLTGKPPFVAANVKDVMLARLSHNAPDVRTLVPGASVRVAALLARLMARNPNERYQLPQDVINDISAILEPPSAPSARSRASVRAPMAAPAARRGPVSRQAPHHHDEDELQEETPRPAAPVARTYMTMGIVIGVIVGALVVAMEMRSRDSTQGSQLKAKYEASERAKEQEKARTWFREEQEKRDQDFGKALVSLRAQTRVPLEKRVEGYQDMVARYPLASRIKEAADELEAARTALKSTGSASQPVTQVTETASTEIRALMNQGEPYKANEKLVNLAPEAKTRLGAQYQALIAECERAIETITRDATAKARASAAAGKRDEARQVLEAAREKVDPATRKELNELIEELCGTKE